MNFQGITPEQKTQYAKQILARSKKNSEFKTALHTELQKYREIKLGAKDKTYLTAIAGLPDTMLMSFVESAQKPEEFKEQQQKKSLMTRAMALPAQTAKYLKEQITPKPRQPPQKTIKKDGMSEAMTQASEKQLSKQFQTRPLLPDDAQSMMSQMGQSVQTRKQQNLNKSQSSMYSGKSSQNLLDKSQTTQSVKSGGNQSAKPQSIKTQQSVKEIPDKPQQPEKQNQPVKVNTKSNRSVQYKKQQVSFSQSSESAKSHKQKASVLFEKLTKDPIIQQRIPTLQLIQQQERQGVITKEDANHAMAEIISSSMKSSKAVQQAVHDKTQELMEIESGSSKKSLSQQSLYGQFDIDDETNNAKREESNSVAGQTSQVDQFRNPIIFGKDGYVQDDSKEKVIEFLEAVVNKSGSSSREGMKASQILENMQRSQIQSDISEFVVEYPSASLEKDPEAIGQNEMQDFPQGALQVSNLQDLLATEQYVELVEEWSAKQDLTTDQRELVSAVLFDIDDLKEAYFDFGDVSHYGDSSSSSFAGDKQYGQSEKSQNYSQFMAKNGYGPRQKGDQLVNDQTSNKTRSTVNADITQSYEKISNKSKKILHNITFDNGDYGQQVVFEDIDANGNQINIDKLLKVAESLVEKISKLSGDISAQMTYKDIKKQTQVYGTQIQQKETNNFKIQQGSLFALRSCC